MSPDTFTDLWRAGGASVRGANHARAARPNQDALRWLPAPGALICALSDGHGSDKSFRSDLGALFAVQTALTVIPDTLMESVPAKAAALAERLPRIIVDAWRQAVECHLAEAPFTDAEWTRLSAQAGDGTRPAGATPSALPTATRAIEDRVPAGEGNWWLAYGATFLLCVVTPEFILYAQLGDGDILLVSQDGAVARPNWQADPRLFANETTSLCMPEAWAEMRVDVQPIATTNVEPAHDVQPDSSPALILLATDGYANSFVDDSAFVRVGSDLLAMVRADGFETVCAGLPAWLEETSRLGSGDDITVGLVYRTPAAAIAPAAALDQLCPVRRGSRPAPRAKRGHRMQAASRQQQANV
jgi:Protein phosphatase 2C